MRSSDPWLSLSSLGPMTELLNIALEDDDGNVILPPDPRKNGNCFAVRHLPARGDEVHVNDSYYVVVDIIHRLHHQAPNIITLRLRPKSLSLDE